MSLPPRRLVSVLFALCLWSLPAAADTDEQRTRQQLDELRQDIQALTKELNQARSRRGELQEDLRRTEVALGELSAKISVNQDQRAEQGRKLAALEARRSELRAARDAQQELVRRELGAAYQMGRESHLKILLNQEQPDTLARAMAYYEYFYRARSEHIDAYRQTLAELDAVEPEIRSVTAALEQTRATLAGQQQQLAASRRQRQQTLARLENSISSRGDELKQLELDRAELEQVLQALEEALVNMTLPEEYRDFSEARGELPWPLDGKRRNLFGKSRNEGKMRWQGVRIDAAEGTTVQAIHHGRVVYADWLRGSGLLLILDHGDGYMSLYAHNQSLLREVGEWVGAGSPIATVGNTGGQRTAALYFEIRHNGKPVNPGRWCRG